MARLTQTAVGGVLAVMTIVGFSSVAPGSSAAAAPVTDCVAEPFTWFGPLTIEPGASASVGSVPEGGTGVQIMVTATDSSPVVLPIRIGGDPVSIGSSVLGGAVTVTNTGATAVEISSVAVGLDRCRQVAVEAPAGDPPGSAASAAASAATPSPGPAVVELPGTGAISRRVALVAMASTLLGVALVLGSRRGRHPVH